MMLQCGVLNFEINNISFVVFRSEKYYNYRLLCEMRRTGVVFGKYKRLLYYKWECFIKLLKGIKLRIKKATKEMAKDNGGNEIDREFSGTDDVKMQFIVPQPGNYPLDCFLDSVDGCTYSNVPPKEKETVVVTFDIRGFTALTENNPTDDVVCLLTEFYEGAANIIKASEGFVSKYLGDAVFAYFPKEKIAEVPKVLFDIFSLFDCVKSQYAFAMNENTLLLSGAIVKGSNYHVQIGIQQYIDNTIIGREVNKCFRLSKVAKRNQIWIDDTIKDRFNSGYVVLRIGEQKLKGMENVVALWIVRERTGIEKKKGQASECCKLCEKHGTICEIAFRQALGGGNKAGAGKVACMNCVHAERLCGQFHSCKSRENGDAAECCDICSDFRHCYISRKAAEAMPHKMVCCGYCGNVNNGTKVCMNRSAMD